MPLASSEDVGMVGGKNNDNPFKGLSKKPMKTSIVVVSSIISYPEWERASKSLF